MKKPFTLFYPFFIILIVFYFFNISYTYAVQTTSVLPKKANKKTSIKSSFSRKSVHISDGVEPDEIEESDPLSEMELTTEELETEGPETEEDLSAIEKFFSGELPDSVSTDIRQFGYDLFREPSSKFTPDKSVPVGPDYVIGPEDEVKITVWGKINGDWEVKVSRDGNITLPEIGVIGVAGLTFSEMKEAVHKAISKYYTGFNMNVTMGSLRTIRVYIVGNAKNPGAYTVSSLSSIVSALFEASGPSKTGSMRDIRLKRNGKSMVHLDLYDLLLEGDKTNDMRLLSEDVIFIPPIGPTVGISGNVKKPAIYELKNEKKLSQLIDMAGGLTSTAFKGRMQIQRIKNHEVRVLFEGNLLDDSNRIADNFILKDGDLVKLYSVSASHNTATLAGAVSKEGEYAIKSGVTRVRDVIEKAGGLLYYSSQKAELTRHDITPEGMKTKFIDIDLTKALKGDPEHNLPLEQNDYLHVKFVPDWDVERKVEISGEVKFPGNYTIKKEEKLSSLIARAGGYTDAAYLRGAVFVRERVKEIQQQSLDQMVERLERELFSQASSGVSTAISQSEISAKTAEMEQKKQFIETLKQLEATGRMTIRLTHPRLLKGSDYDIILENGDSLYIPKENSVVNVLGSVMSRGSFVYSGDFDYKDYINMAGGYTGNADEDNVYVLKVDGTAKKLSSGLFSWNGSKSRWELSGFGEQKDIEPGDSIVVPEELERIAWMREIKDVTQILYRIAVAAAVVVDLND